MVYIKQKSLRVNGQIRSDNVRLIDQDSNQVGVVGKHEAQNMANEAGLDLVEVAPTSNPPVCRIMDYGKWLYEQKRKAREAHKKSSSHSQTLKEIRLRPETEDHDLNIKLKSARKFLEKGNKVQFSVFFRGRQMLHQDRGYEMLEHISESLEDIAKVERTSKITGRRMTLLVGPK